MSDNRSKNISKDGKSQDARLQKSVGMKRRDLLLSSSTLLAASALSANALVNPTQAQQRTPTVAAGQEAQHPRHLG